MTSRAERARELLAPLRRELQAGVSLREEQQHGEATRVGYEVIEKALKSALLWADVEPPPWVDVGPQLDDQRPRFTAEFQSHIDMLIYAARVSWEERETGFELEGEDHGAPLYDDYDAASALETAERVLSVVEQLFA